MLIQDIMTPDPTCVTAATTTADARAQMDALNCRHLPVLDGANLTGIITHRDLNRPGETVGELMSTQLITARPTLRVDAAAATMAVHKVGCLPVVEHGRLVGIVTTYDLLDALVRWLRSHLPADVDPEGTPY